MAGTEHKEHVVSPGVYITIVILLMVLLVITIVMAFVDIDHFTQEHHLGSGWNTGIALAIAIIKAILIILFFMHIKYAAKLTWAFAAAGFVWLAIMIVLTMTDYMTRNHPAGSTPRGEPRYFLPAPG